MNHWGDSVEAGFHGIFPMIPFRKKMGELFTFVAVVISYAALLLLL
jgi:hypothetical protein